jgi:hypothetical protein
MRRNFGSDRLECTKSIRGDESKTYPPSEHSNVAELSYRVDRLSARTVAPHGMTAAEIRRLSAATHFMRSKGHRLWWLTTNASEDAQRSSALIYTAWKRITRLQSRAELPQYSVAVFEGGKGLHSHIVFIGTAAIAKRLQGSKLSGQVDVKPVTNLEGLIRGYLIKTRTPQAQYGRGHMFGGRIRGSHKLPGGGDRVRLSRELQRDAIKTGQVAPGNARTVVAQISGKPIALASSSKRHPRRRGKCCCCPSSPSPSAVSVIMEAGECRPQSQSNANIT